VREGSEVLVVGGGFAGFWAAMAARRVGMSRVSITLVSREPVLQIRPRLYEAAPESLAVDMVLLLERVNVRFVQGEANGIDASTRSVALADGRVLPYDRLVVATGSAMRRPPVPGAGKAYSVDSQSEAITFDRRLREIARGTREPRVAVIGAGFTGIELALELRDRVAVHGGSARAEALQIFLIDRASVVGPELGEGPRPLIESALRDARIECRLAATVSELASDRVNFADGSVLDVDAVVLTTGMVAAAFARHVPGERDGLGRVVVDRSLRVPAFHDIFVAGDAAAADGGDGHPILQSCQHALQAGRFAGENAARDLLGLPVLEYVQPPYITCLDLGRSGAVFTRGWDRHVEKSGSEAKAIKRRINRQTIYPPADATGDELIALSSLDPAEQRLSRPSPPGSTRSLSGATTVSHPSRR
jgi:NADH dehydrogenase